MSKTMTLKDEIKMTYDDYVEYLLSKYGPATADYFRTKECKTKGKVSRTAEGLFCHHIDENKFILLSHPEFARLAPFDFQKKERLCYCNYFEHLLLHIKIAKEYGSVLDVKLGVGGIILITKDINDIYMYGMPSTDWQRNCAEQINSRYGDYVEIIKYLVKQIKKDKIRGIKVRELFKTSGGIFTRLSEDVKE